MHYLYRNFVRRAIATWSLVFLAVTFSGAQGRPQHRDNPQAQPATGTSAKKAKRGPRAIAVVEFLPGGRMQLVPIALWIEGHYYDASLYSANPEPMAIEPQTVYEAQSFGEPTGTFTITAPKQVNGNWAADGNWQPHLVMDLKLSQQAAKDAAQKPKSNPSAAVMTGNEDDTRPVLKRAPGSAPDTANGSETPPARAPTTDKDPDRPVMKKPAQDASGKPTLGSTDEPPANTPTSTAKTQTTVDDKDPNRPVFKRTSPAAAQSDSGDADSKAVTKTAAASNDSDPNRPMLSHNKPAKAITTASASEKNDLPSPPAGKAARSYPAISDAGSFESRSLLYSMSSGERQVFEQQTLKVAIDEIRAFVAKRKGPAIPKGAALTDYDVRAYDLEFSNSPTVVVSAKLPIAGAKGVRGVDFSYFVTVVARIDINDQAQKIFSLVSDSNHLDAFPRMELIDAVDADANGRGDLLFRQYSDVGISYSLYRVSPYQIEKIFEGGSSL